MTALFRSNRESMLIPSMQGQNILFISETFSRDAFDDLLAETGATGLRFYLGMQENQQVSIVAVAIDENGYDILPDPNTLEEPPGGAKIAELGIHCPPICPPPTQPGKISLGGN
jgi:hypothetical protein